MIKYLRQLASESLVYGLSGTVTRFVTVFLVPLYTRVLTPEDYGVVSLVRNATALVAVFASLALDSAAHRFYWDSEDIADRKATLATWACPWLFLTTLSGILIIIFANVLATGIIGTAKAAQPLRVAAATMPLGALSVLYMNRLRMQRRPWSFALFALVTSLVSVLLAGLFVLILRRGVEGVFEAQFVTSVLAGIFLLAVFVQWMHPRHFDGSRLVKMLRYGIPMLPGIVAFWVIDVIDRYFLQAYSTTAEVGLYEIAYSIAAVVALVTTAFQQAWIPFAMSIQDVPNARAIYSKTLIAYTWCGCIVATLVTLFAPEALRILTTKAYYQASTVVGPLSLSYVFMGAAYIVALGTTIKKRTSSIGAAFVIAAVINVGLNVWLVPRHGRDGAALATLLAYLVVPIYLYYRSQQAYEIQYPVAQSLAVVCLTVSVMWIGTTRPVDNPFGAVLFKISLLLLFVPLLFVLRIVTWKHLRGIADGFRLRRFTESPSASVPSSDLS